MRKCCAHSALQKMKMQPIRPAFAQTSNLDCAWLMRITFWSFEQAVFVSVFLLRALSVKWSLDSGLSCIYLVVPLNLCSFGTGIAVTALLVKIHLGLRESWPCCRYYSFVPLAGTLSVLFIFCRPMEWQCSSFSCSDMCMLKMYICGHERNCSKQWHELIHLWEHLCYAEHEVR